MKPFGWQIYLHSEGDIRMKLPTFRCIALCCYVDLHFRSMFILSTMPMKKQWFHLSTVRESCGRVDAVWRSRAQRDGTNNVHKYTLETWLFLHQLPEMKSRVPGYYIMYYATCHPCPQKTTTAWHPIAPLGHGSHGSAGHAEKTLRGFGSWLRSCPATSGKRFVIAGNHDFWLEDSPLFWAPQKRGRNRGWWGTGAT